MACSEGRSNSAGKNLGPSYAGVLALLPAFPPPSPAQLYWPLASCVPELRAVTHVRWPSTPRPFHRGHGHRVPEFAIRSMARGHRLGHTLHTVGRLYIVPFEKLHL